jgi:cyclophilin family peptidyl-prolyl cis-trans isomerase
MAPSPIPTSWFLCALQSRNNQEKEKPLMADIKDPENTIVMETSKGTVVIELRPDLAPGHVERMKELTREGFYDGIVFHRVIDGFMAQVGCPKGNGTGGSDKPDLKAEFSQEKHVRGTISAARSANPNSANSQFFICFDEAPWLNGQYSVFGKVIEGMDIVDQLEKGEPVRNPDKIVSMKVAADAA